MHQEKKTKTDRKSPSKTYDIPVGGHRTRDVWSTHVFLCPLRNFGLHVTRKPSPDSDPLNFPAAWYCPEISLATYHRMHYTTLPAWRNMRCYSSILSAAAARGGAQSQTNSNMMRERRLHSPSKVGHTYEFRLRVAECTRTVITNSRPIG